MSYCSATYKDLEKYAKTKQEVWGFYFSGFASDNYVTWYTCKKPQKGIIEKVNSEKYYFLPLNKKGKPLKSKKIPISNLSLGMDVFETYEECIKVWNHVLNVYQNGCKLAIEMCEDGYKLAEDSKIVL